MAWWLEYPPETQESACSNPERVTLFFFVIFYLFFIFCIWAKPESVSSEICMQIKI